MIWNGWCADASVPRGSTRLVVGPAVGLPHPIGAAEGPCEILGVFDRDARRGHDVDEKARASTISED
ncbi:MAG: hypothetical protein JWR34_3632 [Mycobacterium sp.]|nr:hypothetical protein [Mycobacterium sp.]